MAKWSLYNNKGVYLNQLTWGYGGQVLTLDEILAEFMVDSKKQKVISYLSKCGSGKSAVLLHTGMNIGRGAIVTPSIVLQNQYKNDYYDSNGKYLLKNDGARLKIGTMMGRRNFKCMYAGLDHCNYQHLPCNKRLKKGETRIEVGSECRWFIPPPIGASFIDKWTLEGKLDRKLNILGCEGVAFYDAVDGNEYGLFIRNINSVCPYYRQFYNYLPDYCDMIIFNNQKWQIEGMLGRKPRLDIECVDEADDFLYGLQDNITVSYKQIDALYTFTFDKMGRDITQFIKLNNKKKELLNEFEGIFVKIKEIQNKGSLNNNDFELRTKVYCFINMLFELENDEGVDVSDNILDLFYKLEFLGKYSDKVIVTVEEEGKDKQIVYSIPYPDVILKNILNNCSDKVLFCSATTPGDFVLEKLYNLTYDKVIHGRIDQPGELILATLNSSRRLLDVTYENWKNPEFQKEYNDLMITVLSGCNVNGRTLVLTNAKKYVKDTIEFLKDRNVNMTVDFAGEEYKNTKGIANEIVISSKRMSRGVDLHDDLCRNIIIAKYPFPNLGDPYVQALFMRFGNDAWNILNDNAEKTLIQMVCRGIRNDKDWCVFFSPDIRANTVVHRWWREQEKLKRNGNVKE